MNCFSLSSDSGSFFSREPQRLRASCLSINPPLAMKRKPAAARPRADSADQGEEQLYDPQQFLSSIAPNYSFGMQPPGTPGSITDSSSVASSGCISRR